MPSFKVTSPELNIRPLPDKENTPIGRLKEGAIVEKLGESGDWAFIRITLETKDFSGDIVGWVSGRFFTPADQVIEPVKTELPDEPFNIDSNLKERPSPLTAEFIESYVKKKGPDLAGVGEPVMAAAKKYGINATYIVAHAIHESGWGTSKMSREKHNLFGFQAYDYDTGQAVTFDCFADCIDFVMRYVNTNYLTEGGKYFEGEPCLGDKVEGYGMNVHYATDPHWAQAIAEHADNLENWVRTLAEAPTPKPEAPMASLKAKRILEAVARVNPEQAYYEPHDITHDGYPETFCNWFVADALTLLGIELPCYDASAGYCSPGHPIFPDGRFKPKSANELNVFFNDGGDGDWDEVDRKAAVRQANKGKIVVASIPGHIALVIPGGHGSEVHIAQAGARCGKDMPLKDGFGHEDVQFFQYTA